MKPEKNIEEFVKLEKPHVTTGGEMDSRTLSDSFEAMDNAARTGWRSTAEIILRSRAARLAAAAVIIVAVGLLMVYRNPPVQPPPETVSVAKSPAEMLTAKSLIIAYRHGGIEAVERQCDKALKMQGPRLDKLDIKELFAEIETDLERMEL